MFKLLKNIGDRKMSISLLSRLFLLLVSLILLFGCSKPQWEDFQGGIHLVLEVESKGSTSVDKENTIEISNILEERIKQLGIKHRIVKIIGERQLIIQLPKVKNPSMVIDLFRKSFLLEFKLLDDESPITTQLPSTILPENEEKFLKQYVDKIPETDEILFGKIRNKETGKITKQVYLIEKQSLMTGEFLTEAKVNIDKRYNEPYISISFNSTGAKLFEKITASNIKKRLAIILDDNVYSAPVIQERISGGNAMISGSFTIQEARDIAIVLRAGAYPAQTSVVESRELTRELWLGDPI